MQKKTIILLLLIIHWSTSLQSQQREFQSFRIISYNVENYFDCEDDSITDDSEFLPGGMRGWNYAKYRQKQANIAKVIAAISAWDTPALIGLCEVESRKALIDLTLYSPLKSFNYKFIHHDSPDARGIDVALLYQPYLFFPISNEAIPVQFLDRGRKTRDILYVSGTTLSDDTLHIFINHFPSRLGGELESESRRLYVASVLRSKIDSLFFVHAHPNILIMGDFNDYPTNKSMTEKLKAKPPSDSIIHPTELYNLTYNLHHQGKGTHKHNGEWGMLDQIIVSGTLLNTQNSLFIKGKDASLFDSDFLLMDDEKYLGKQPFRTYNGMKYNGGFSDHLPLYIDFQYIQ